MEMDNLISCYTWDDAVEDGTFIDISEQAKEWKFTLPVAMTANLFSKYVRRIDSKGCEVKTATNSMIVLMLIQLRQAIKNNPEAENMLSFNFPYNGRNLDIWTTIEARSPENPEPAMTLMLPEDM